MNRIRKVLIVVLIMVVIASLFPFPSFASSVTSNLSLTTNSYEIEGYNTNPHYYSLYTNCKSYFTKNKNITLLFKATSTDKPFREVFYNVTKEETFPVNTISPILSHCDDISQNYIDKSYEITLPDFQPGQDEAVYDIRVDTLYSDNQATLDVIKIIYSKKDYAVTMPGANLALNKTATASQSNSSSETPDKAVNGNSSDKWCTGWTSNEKWLKVDLGGMYEINRWVVYHAGVYEYWHPEYNTRNFRLQYSEDGTNWSTADTVTQNTSNITERSTPTFLARYVRLYIDYSDQVNACARIYELQLYNDQKTNIAFNNTATASEYYGSQTPAKAVNGSYTDTNDKWCTGWSTNPKWLKVDLGKVYTINKWRVVHAGAVETSHPEYNTRNFRLQKSSDGVNWENVDVVTGNTSSLTERKLANPISTRYVRLYIDQGQQDKDSCARIYEFQLYYD